MNFWPTMQEMLSPDDAGKSAPAPNAGRAATALKPLPEDALIIIPLRNAVLFPGIMSPVTIGRPSSVAAAQEAARSERRVGFLLQRDPEKNELQPETCIGSVPPARWCATSPAPKARTTW